MDVAKHLVAELVRGAHGVEQGHERPHGAADDPPALHAQRAQHLAEQGQHLDLARDVLATDKLHAQLSELTGLAAQGGLLAHDGRLVAQAHGHLAHAVALGRHAGDGQREVRA